MESEDCVNADACENGIQFVEKKNEKLYCASCSPYCNSDDYNNTKQATVSTCDSHVFVKRGNVKQCLKLPGDCVSSTMVLSEKYDKAQNTECVADNNTEFYVKKADGSNPPYKFSCVGEKYPYKVQNH